MARHDLTDQRAGRPLPREALSLAINSPYGRTQDELHIHIDCVRRDVRDALAAHRDAIKAAWDTFPAPLAGQPWRALRIDGDNLGPINPFQLLARSDPDAAADMGKHTLVVVGMTWPGDSAGFAMLDGKVDLVGGNHGSGEDLQDHDCALARTLRAARVAASRYPCRDATCPGWSQLIWPPDAAASPRTNAVSRQTGPTRRPVPQASILRPRQPGNE